MSLVLYDVFVWGALDVVPLKTVEICTHSHCLQRLWVQISLGDSFSTHGPACQPVSMHVSTHTPVGGVFLLLVSQTERLFLVLAFCRELISCSALNRSLCPWWWSQALFPHGRLDPGPLSQYPVLILEGRLALIHDCHYSSLEFLFIYWHLEISGWNL